jgi:hypothetical protein
MANVKEQAKAELQRYGYFPKADPGVSPHRGNQQGVIHSPRENKH